MCANVETHEHGCSAIKASFAWHRLGGMSLPGVAPPVERDGRLLVYGGIANNLPINVVRKLRADVVIAMKTLKKAGCSHLYCEAVHGPMLQQALDRPNHGYVLTVERLDTLVVSLHGLAKVLTAIASRKARLVSVRDEIDPAEATSLQAVAALLACLDHRLRSRATSEGLARVKRAGGALGRKRAIAIHQLARAIEQRNARLPASADRSFPRYPQSNAVSRMEKG